MATITKTIREMPLAPSSARPASFEAEADGFIAQIPGFGEDLNEFRGQTNLLAEELNLAASQTQSALNATNVLTTTATQKASDASNAAAAATNAANVSGTSTTALTPTLGQNNVFVYVETGRTPFIGMRMRAVSRAAPATNFALGYVNAWNPTTRTITLAIDQISTLAVAAADWNLVLEGQPGVPGAEAEVLMPGLTANTNLTLVNNDNGKNIDCTAQIALSVGAVDPGWSVIVHALGFPVTINATFNDGTFVRTMRARSSGILSYNGVSFRFARMGAQLPFAQTIQTIGVTSLVAPFGVIGVKATVTGGGGAAYSFNGFFQIHGAAGGTAIKTFPISPGQSLTCTVGRGGIGSGQTTGPYNNNCDGVSSSLVANGFSLTAGGTSGPESNAYPDPGGGNGGDINIIGGRSSTSMAGASYWGGGTDGGLDVATAFGAGGMFKPVFNTYQSGAQGVIYLEWIMG